MSRNSLSHEVAETIIPNPSTVIMTVFFVFSLLIIDFNAFAPSSDVDQEKQQPTLIERFNPQSFTKSEAK